MARLVAALAVVCLATLARGASAQQSDARTTSVGNDTKQGWVGLRVGVTRIHNDTATSLQLAGRGEELRTHGLFSTHGAHFFGIGGGSAGFDGSLGALLTFGVRAPVAENHGPFVRAGARGHLMGNQAFYSSLIELPRGELGWQYIRGWTVLELGGSYGAVLTGRFRPGDVDARILGSGLAPGLYTAVQLPVLRVGAAVARIPSRDGTKVDTADAHACVIAYPIGLCGDASFMRAGTETRTWYGGVTLAVMPPAVGRPWSKPQSAPNPVM